MPMSNRARFAIALALLTIFVDIGLARLAYGLLLPATRAELGGPYGAYGIVGAVHLAGYLIGTFAAPPIMRRYGVARALCVAQLSVGAFLIASSLVHDVVTLGLARLVIGIASGVGIVAAVGIALEAVQPARRGVVSGIIWAGAGIALALSAPLGGWSLEGPGRWRIATDLLAVPSIIAGVAALRVQVASSVQGADGGVRFAWAELLRPDRFLFLLAAYVAFGFAYICYATFIVAALYRNGFSHPIITAVWAAYGIAAATGSLLVGRVLSGPLASFSMAFALGSAMIGAALSVIPGVAATLAGAFFVGLGFAAMPAVVSAHTRERSVAATAAGAFAAVTGIMSFGQICGPIGGGFVADAFGIGMVPALSAVVYAMGTVCALVDASIAKRLSSQE